MYCSHCGAQIADGSQFCGCCGAAQGADGAAEIKQETETQTQFAGTGARPGISALKIVGICLMFLSAIVDIISIGLIPGIKTMGDVGSFNALTIISSLGFVVGLILTLIPTKR